MQTKRHNYEYAVDTASQTAPANVVRLIGTNKRVLEIGCDPGSITKILSEQNGCIVTGLELDPIAIEKVKPFCEVVKQADLNSPDWPRLLDGIEKFDVVLAADVLEHLYDPQKSLQQMIPLMKDNGCIVISLPHIGHAAILSCLISGNFKYGDLGLLDRTHIRFFCLQKIENLFTQANLKIIEAKFVTKTPSETEFAEVWASMPHAVQDVLMTPKHANVYQVVIKAVPINRIDSAIMLIPPAFTYQPHGLSIKTWIGQYLNASLKSIIRSAFNRIGLKI